MPSPPLVTSEVARRGPAAEGSESAQARRQDAIDQQEKRNFILLILQQIVLRLGWVFKTESVIMPAFMDTVAPGANTLRSLLPLLNRFGQSLPPLFLAHSLKHMPRKKMSLAVTSGLMSLTFLVLSGLWFLAGRQGTPWLAAAFLVLYAFFFCCTGMNNLALSTLHGKLIQVTHRGRLMAVAAALGAVFCVMACFLLMGPWLTLPDGGFGWLFLFAGSCFLLSTFFALSVREPADTSEKQDVTAMRRLQEAWHVFKCDGNFRRLAAVAMLFSTALLLFPHYQALARERLNLAGTHLMIWVVVQNASIGVFSLLIGPLADARGNRLTLRTIILATALTPLLAIVLTFEVSDAATGQTHLLIDPEIGRRLFWLIFAPLGLTPLTMRTMNNYTLELCQAEDHPRYLATLSLCLSLPFFLSPLVGVLIDQTSFEVVFLGGFASLVLCGLLTFRLYEPRHDENDPPYHHQEVPGPTPDV